MAAKNALKEDKEMRWSECWLSSLMQGSWENVGFLLYQGVLEVPRDLRVSVSSLVWRLWQDRLILTSKENVWYVFFVFSGFSPHPIFLPPCQGGSCLINWVYASFWSRIQKIGREREGQRREKRRRTYFGKLNLVYKIRSFAGVQRSSRKASPTVTSYSLLHNKALQNVLA